MDRHGIRYMYEHRLLPNWFFEDKEQFVGMILQDKAVLYRIIEKIFDKENLPNPYKEDEFDIDVTKIVDDVLMLKIIFPEPEEEPLCYCAYMFFDSQFEKTSYFCIEKGNEAGNMCPFVCSWTTDSCHHNYGGCTFENYGDFLRCAEIHMENHYGMIRKNTESTDNE